MGRGPGWVGGLLLVSLAGSNFNHSADSMTGGAQHSQVMLLPAIVFITAAPIFYAVGVWSEHLQRVLKWWHAGLFAVGPVCDATGTFLMSKIASSTVALLLMVVHLAWAVVVLARNREAKKSRFRKSSLVVWDIWPIPQCTGPSVPTWVVTPEELPARSGTLDRMRACRGTLLLASHRWARNSGKGDGHA